MFRTILGSIILIIAVLAVGGGIGWIKYRSIVAQMEAPPPPESPESVLIVAATETAVRQDAVSIGTVLAPQSLHLRSELVGIIESIPMKSGAIVEPNELLVQFDTSVEKAQLLSAQASKKIADSTFRRTRQAAQANAATQLELEQTEAMLAQADAEILRLEAIIRKKTLRAPFKSRVGLFDIHPGQYIQEGTEIAMLQGIDDFVSVDFSMPQQVADELKLGDPVVLRSHNQAIEAPIMAIDSQADRLTRGVKARARVDNPPSSMQPNDSVRVEMEYGVPVQGVLVPAASLRRSPNGSFVYTVQVNDAGESRAHQQDVIAGKTVGDQVVVLRGVNAGQKVVADGSFKIREGSLLMESNIGSSVASKAGANP